MISSRRLKLQEKKQPIVRFSRHELKDLLKAWIAISIAFAIVNTTSFDIITLVVAFLAAALTAGVGFLVHEIAHKVIAQRYGCWAEFRAYNEMLIFAIVMSFFKILFAAPGAVMIIGHTDKEKDGKISISGPLSNMLVAIIFLAIGKIATSGFISEVFMYGFTINIWFAIFNLIPIGIFDGEKIFKWNKIIYAIFVITALASYFVLPRIL